LSANRFEKSERRFRPENPDRENEKNAQPINEVIILAGASKSNLFNRETRKREEIFLRRRRDESVSDVAVDWVDWFATNHAEDLTDFRMARAESGLNVSQNILTRPTRLKNFLETRKLFLSNPDTISGLSERILVSTIEREFPRVSMH
jgi:hypothetical protein